MKRHFNHPPAPETGKKYWRSLEEFAQTPEFQARLAEEFPRGASELNGSEISRRGFMQFMGASVALAGLGLTACRRPEIDIIAYSKGVEWQIPGVALRYATAQPRRGGALPLLATTYSGRPTKLEGNPEVPGFKGKTDLFGQAAILDLYDPDRAKAFYTAQDRGTNYQEMKADDFWKNFQQLRAEAQKDGGAGLAILAEPSTSPTRDRLRQQLLQQFPQLTWAEYEPWSDANRRSALGEVGIVYDLEKADVILALDADFLGASDGTVQNIGGFAAGRRRLGQAQETMSRLYAVESRFSLTGGMADHRLRVPSSNIYQIAQALAHKIGASSIAAPDSSYFSDATVSAWVDALAKDLMAAEGRSLVMVGSQQHPALHALAADINETLNNVGKTLSYLPTFTSPALSIADLTSKIQAGAVKTLLILGGNPAFNAPAELKFGEALNKVGQVIRWGLHLDETTAASTLHVPAAHFLEAWGDLRAPDGTYLSQQPLILPLYQGVSELEFLGVLAGWPQPKGAEYIQDTFAQVVKIDRQAGLAFDQAWQQFVHDGYLAGSAAVPINAYAISANPGKLPPQPLASGEYELGFYLGNIDDGRYANNGWLQEVPDTVSKLTWENVLYVGPKNARELGLEVLPNNFRDLPDTDSAPGIDPTYWSTYPIVKLTTRDGLSLEVPAYVAPGQAENTFSLALGWGRTGLRLTDEAKANLTPALRVADGAGVNAYQVRIGSTTGFVTGVKIEKTGRFASLAISQEHNSMEGRGLVREATLEKYHENPAFVQQIGLDTRTPEGDNRGYQNYENGYATPRLNGRDYQPDRPAWGMTIDLNTCVGCNACVVACQAENNIPIVGKWQVIRGREMHWIRIDRYFASDDTSSAAYLEDPQMLFEPLACQQCENAPCEPVCPVNATVHNEEGLNVMAYNRCIGTRYCANNCPYKVRRFNFFNYNDRPIENVKLPVLGQTGELYLGPLAGRDGPLTYKGSPQTIALQKNPNVSVRIRGVMEKCTYCVQRIEEAKIAQLRKSNENETGSGDITLPTDGFQVACQQACPAEAIVFGNLNDPQSQVSISKADERNYGLLAYLDTRPRTTYLGRVRNPNPAMPGADHIGHTSPFAPEPAAKPADKSTLATPLHLEELPS